MVARDIRLLLTFLQKTWPRYDRVPEEYARWEDLTGMFFKAAPMIRSAAETQGHLWTARSVRVIDDWLLQMAESGIFDGTVTIPEGAAEELWRRWQYAIIGCKLEATAVEHIDVPVPSDAPDDIKSTAMLLFVLGGMARQYPRAMYK